MYVCELTASLSLCVCQTGDEAAVVGTLDILVNCAGIAQTTLLKRTPDLELASIVDTNLLAPMLVCKYAKIKPNGTESRPRPPGVNATARLTRIGCIINVSSLMATKGDLGVTAYAASKAGLVGACTCVHYIHSSFLHGSMAILVPPCSSAIVTCT